MASKSKRCIALAPNRDYILYTRQSIQNLVVPIGFSHSFEYPPENSLAQNIQISSA